MVVFINTMNCSYCHRSSDYRFSLPRIHNNTTKQLRYTCQGCISVAWKEYEEIVKWLSRSPLWRPNRTTPSSQEQFKKILQDHRRKSLHKKETDQQELSDMYKKITEESIWYEFTFPSHLLVGYSFFFLEPICETITKVGNLQIIRSKLDSGSVHLLVLGKVDDQVLENIRNLEWVTPEIIDKIREERQERTQVLNSRVITGDDFAIHDL